MRLVLRLAAAVALALVVLPSLFVALGRATLETNKTLMLAGTVLWFVAVPLARRAARKG
jgi:hypothetical protein